MYCLVASRIYARESLKGIHNIRDIISFPPTHDKTSDTFRGKNMKNMTNTGRHMTGKKAKFDLLFHL